MDQTSQHPPQPPGPTTTAEPEDTSHLQTRQPEPQRRDWREGLRDFSSLRRSVEDSKVAGVAGGLGRHLGIDPIILRVLFVVLAFFGGSGLLLYVSLWLLTPLAHRERARLHLSERWRSALLVASAVVAALLAIGDAASGFGFPWFLIVVLFVVAIFLSRRDSQGGSWRAPKGRGPLLILPTLGLVAVGLGGLGIADGAGANVDPTAYPALALALIGAMLVLGSVWGRAGGLVALGLLAVAAMPIVGVVDPTYTGDREISRTPAYARDLASDYNVPAGTIDLDLTAITDPAELAGRTVTVAVNAGEVRLILPEDLSVRVETEVSYGGEIRRGDSVQGGWGIDSTHDIGPDSDTPLIIDVTTGFGAVRIDEVAR